MPQPAAAEGYREVIDTGRRRLARIQEAEPLRLKASVQSALAELVERGRRVDFLLLNAGMVPGKKRVLTATGVEAAQATLSGHHQLTVGLLHSPSN